MKAPKVTVLMAVYNAAQYLPQALISLVTQTMSDWEVICVDDASTDVCPSILRDFSKQDERIRVLRLQENQGQAVARNVALREARGQYICMLDADDWLSANALQQAVEVMEQHEQCDAVLFRLVKCYEDGREEDYFDSVASERGRSVLNRKKLDKTVLSGIEAMRKSLDWRIHGLYLIRADIHRRYPYDTSYRLYSDDNTTHLHYLHSREVRFCQGIYYWRQYEDSMTHKLDVRHFLHMRANQQLLAALKAEKKVPAYIIDEYEQFRWRVFEEQFYAFYWHLDTFTEKEQQFIESELRDVFSTLKDHGDYNTYYLKTRLRMRLGHIRRKLKN